MIGNKIAGTITNVSEKSTKELPNDEADAERAKSKKRDISPEERRQIIDKLRLVPKKDV